MKAKIIVIIASILPMFASAQYTDLRKAQLGFTTSPTFGWFSVPSGQTPVVEPDGMRSGFSYGVIADLPFSDNYYFATALTVSTLNAKTREPNVSTSVYKLQYLEVPLTLKLKSNEILKKRFYGQFGLNTGINIGSKKDVSYTNSSTADVKNMDIGSEINAFRAGLLLGGGVEWALGESMNVVTGLSYSNGFSDVFDGERKAKSSYIALNLGIFF